MTDETSRPDVNALGSPTLSILMPVYNERERVVEAIDSVDKCNLGVPLELVIVDDGSTDGSAELVDRRAADANWIRVIHHERNMGKGKAIRKGLEHAAGRLTCILDADLEYDPQDLAQLVSALENDRGDAAFGVRAFGGTAAHSYMYVLGNRFVSACLNVLFNCYVRDMMTCLKMMPTDLFRSLDIGASGFEMEAEIASKLISRGHRVYEVPISYTARGREEGKKLRASDGLRVLAMLLKVRLGSRKSKRRQVHAGRTLS